MSKLADLKPPFLIGDYLSRLEAVLACLEREYSKPKGTCSLAAHLPSEVLSIDLEGVEIMWFFNMNELKEFLSDAEE